MAEEDNIYFGADYGLDPNHGLDFGVGEYGNFSGYRIDAGDLGFPSDPTTANQIDAVSKKLSTGAKTIEVSSANIALPGGAMGLMDAIPKQHFEEIRRLKELTGAELSFHGPLVEPTGISRQGWEDTQRQQAEREMFSAVERGHQLNPKGNLPIVFHSSNIGLEPETVVKNEKTGEEEVTQISVIDERTGQIKQGIGPATKDYLQKDPVTQIKEELEKENKNSWFRELQHVNFNAFAGANDIKRATSKVVETDEGLEQEEFGGQVKGYFDFYKKYLEHPEEAEKDINMKGPAEAQILKKKMLDLTHGDIYLRDAYQGLKDLFNRSYDLAERTNDKKSKKILDKYREEMIPKVQELEGNPAKLQEFSDAIIKGVSVLRKINPPQNLKPMKEFMIDKSSDTFSNIAFKSYKKFKDTSPIIAIENPPADRFPLSRADDIRDLIKASRKKFVKRAQDELGLSASEAKKQADKLIGSTWDTAHINLIQGKGYDEKEVLKEVEKIAPYVKHVHISDNFGLGDTELPPGMGTAPIGKTLELIEKYNKKVKKIVETGSWYSALKFRHTPMRESLTAFGSPLYSMKMAPYWNQVAATMGAYYSGFGATNPDVHHSIYGAGYSNLPVELGGQMAGRSRMGGAPIE